MTELLGLRKSSARAAGVVFVGALILATSPSALPERMSGGRAKPNVVIVSIDTLRADHLSGYGYARPTSPNLDRLMASGVRFTQARTVEPLTNPALSSMITSSYPHQHGGSRNGLRVRGGLASLPKAMQGQGYRTAAFVGNWTLRDKLSGLAEHFEMYEEVLTRNRWFGVLRREATADDITELALDWLADHRRRRGDEPFLLWVHYVEPHAPYRVHTDHLAALGLIEGNLTDIDRYDSEIAYVDRSVGDLLAALPQYASPQETIVVFTSDHGESLGEHKYWGHGRNLYEPNLRVPLSVTWEGRIAPGTQSSPALIIDIAPTVLGLAGLASPTDFAGFDWSPVLAGAAAPADRVTHYQAHRGAVISGHDSDLRRKAGLLELGVIHGSTKELFRVENGRREMFDLLKDPFESGSITGPREHPTEGLLEWMRVVYNGLGSFDDETAPPELDAESIEQLRSLGYVD